MKRTVFGHIWSGGIHASLDNEVEFRSIDSPPSIWATHMMRRLCDGGRQQYDYADHAGSETAPENLPDGVLCAACRIAWTMPNIQP